MNARRNCPKCGAELPTDAPEGLCPKCLLKAGLASEAMTLESASSEKTTVVGGADSVPPSGTESLSQAAEWGAQSGHTVVRYFGDYELLEEIARGGMGVVYKGRQVSLNRPVALKMILAGRLATEAEVKRFRLEAEAAANLQHPNIVAIHEIGIHEGQHYFSMDYVEGKDLAHVMEESAEKGADLARAARWMKIIAEAVHYAHQRGTLHRDLKPSNVLIDANEQPRITDFGLAKRLEEDRGLTHTGTVMGSPAYMPPEQATGRLDQIGPQSDVYSLGAILYELLTGRPPFHGGSPLETLEQVTSQEPFAPSKLNPRVPTDLETICLKCLEKQPERRYPSARALAEDLGRFLEHEPILARPASPARKAWSWLGRHPWALAAGAATLLVGAVGLAYGLYEKVRFDRQMVLLTRARALAEDSPSTNAAPSARYEDAMKLVSEAAKVRPRQGVIRAAVQIIASSGKVVQRISYRHAHVANRGTILAETMSKDGRFAAAAFADGAIEVFRLADARMVFGLTNLALAKPVLGLSADGRWLAVADSSLIPGQVKVWEWAKSPEPMVWPAHPGEVTALTFSPAAPLLATAGQTKQAAGGRPEIRLWDLPASSGAGLDSTARPAQVFVVFERDYQRLVEIWSKDKRSRDTNRVGSLSFSPAGTVLAATSAYARRTVFLPLAGTTNDAGSGAGARRWPSELPARSVAFSPDGARCAWITNDDSWRLYVTDTDSSKTRFLGEKVNKQDWFFTGDGKYLISFSDCYDPDTGRGLTVLPGIYVPTHYVQASRPDGVVLISGGAQSFLLWDVAQGCKELERFGIPAWLDRDTVFMYDNVTAMLMPGAVLLGGACILGVLTHLRARQLLRGQRPAPQVYLIRAGIGLALAIFGLALATRLVAAFVWDGYVPGSLILWAWLALVVGLAEPWQAYRHRQTEWSGLVSEEIETPWLVLALMFLGLALFQVLAFRQLFDEEDLPCVTAGLLLGVPLGYTTVVLLAHRAKNQTSRFGAGLLLLLGLGVATSVIIFQEWALVFLFLFQVLAGGTIGWLLASVIFLGARQVTNQLERHLSQRLAKRK